jgi:hypothetical protein
MQVASMAASHRATRSELPARLANRIGQFASWHVLALRLCGPLNANFPEDCFWITSGSRQLLPYFRIFVVPNGLI